MWGRERICFQRLPRDRFHQRSRLPITIPGTKMLIIQNSSQDTIGSWTVTPIADIQRFSPLA
jgi:hypothetical protein